MSCVVSGVSVLNTAGYVDAFFDFAGNSLVKKLDRCFFESFVYRTIGAPGFR